ncbi:hypothetical protein D7V86_01570 [bacterium D16-51]|nr:hypothetical protein D7V96_01000 [bacterium D16-59]RKI62489.1 hypothetical protein D7V86_01570 [bacterium D16-51]
MPDKGKGSVGKGVVYVLPDISLDEKSYDEILDEAINMVISKYPGWTDFNEHDPGITMLELFAVLKESQQFFAGRIGEENRKKYLKLLGMQRKTKQPAESLVHIKADGNYGLLYGHRLEAEGLCFETAHKKQLAGEDVCGCMAVSEGKIEDFISRRQMEFSGILRFWSFGKKPAQGNTMYICFGERLPEKTLLDLFVEVYKGYSVKRNPPEAGFVPLVQLQWQYYTEQGWKELEKLQDETCAFLFDGFIRFVLECPMKRAEVMGRQGYFIRAVLREGEYDAAPAITRISMNICRVIQRETLVECLIQEEIQSSIKISTELCVLGRSEIYIGKDGIFYPVEDFTKDICEDEGAVRFDIEDDRLDSADCVMVLNRDLSYLHKRRAGVGNGFPGQEINLEDLQVLYDGLEILIQDVEKKDGFCLWEKVEDFARSSPEDRHYIFDSDRGMIRFGDCIHGMAPEGEILLAGYVRTMGSDGNVKAGKINRFRMQGLEGLNLSNICDGTGGCDEETLEDSFFRAGQSLKRAECAVTGRDYEEYVMKTPGLMIESCKILHLDHVRQFIQNVDEMTAYLVVKPYGWKKGSRIEDIYVQNIKNYLERYRMAGSQVFIFFPEYVELEVYTEVVVKPQYLHVGERVKQAVYSFFGSYQETFGSVIAYSKLYGYLDRQEFILGIRSLSMDCRGNSVKRSADGDIVLSPYGIAVLKEVKAVLTAG